MERGESRKKKNTGEKPPKNNQTKPQQNNNNKKSPQATNNKKTPTLKDLNRIFNLWDYYLSLPRKSPLQKTKRKLNKKKRGNKITLCVKYLSLGWIMTIFRAEHKTTSLLNTYTSVLVMPNTHSQQQYLLETFRIKQMQSPNATGQVLCHSLTLFVSTLH